MNARFAHGVLPGPRVDQLIASIWLDRAVRTSASPVPAEIKAAADSLFARIDRDGSVLQSQLRQAGLPGPSVSAPTAELLVKETQEHYWVQWLRQTTAVTSEGLHGADVEAIIVRAYGVIGVAISVGGQYLPRATQCASEAEARAFLRADGVADGRPGPYVQLVQVAVTNV